MNKIEILETKKDLDGNIFHNVGNGRQEFKDIHDNADTKFAYCLPEVDGFKKGYTGSLEFLEYWVRDEDLHYLNLESPSSTPKLLSSITMTTMFSSDDLNEYIECHDFLPLTAEECDHALREIEESFLSVGIAEETVRQAIINAQSRRKVEEEALRDDDLDNRTKIEEMHTYLQEQTGREIKLSLAKVCLLLNEKDLDSLIGYIIDDGDNNVIYDLDDAFDWYHPNVTEGGSYWSNLSDSLARVIGEPTIFSESLNFTDYTGRVATDEFIEKFMKLSDRVKGMITHNVVAHSLNDRSLEIYNLNSAFTWSNTPEDHSYWKSVSDEMEGMIFRDVPTVVQPKKDTPCKLCKPDVQSEKTESVEGDIEYTVEMFANMTGRVASKEFIKRLVRLKPLDRARIVENTANYTYNGVQRNTIGFLAHCFNWENSPEGRIYWSSIAEEMSAMKFDEGADATSEVECETCEELSPTVQSEKTRFEEATGRVATDKFIGKFMKLGDCVQEMIMRNVVAYPLDVIAKIYTLNGAFDWRLTPEDHTYWKSVNDEMYDLK